MKRSNKIKKLEIGLALATGLGKFAFMDLMDQKLVFIIAVILAWTLYVIQRIKREKGILAHWGFRSDNFFTVIKMILPYALVATLGLFIIGGVQGLIDLKWYILVLFVLYPIWGTIQHFLTIALVAGNLSELNSKIPRYGIILISATLFAFIHYPDIKLVIGTFFLAAFYTHIYLKERNLYALGVFHGCLGALFYYTVTERDPFLEVFGKYLVGQ